jgi:hypothetical protein
MIYVKRIICHSRHVTHIVFKIPELHSENTLNSVGHFVHNGFIAETEAVDNAVNRKCAKSRRTIAAALVHCVLGPIIRACAFVMSTVRAASLLCQGHVHGNGLPGLKPITVTTRLWADCTETGIAGSNSTRGVILFALRGSDSSCKEFTECPRD